MNTTSLRKNIKTISIALVAIVVGYYLLTLNYTYWGEIGPLYGRNIIGNLKTMSDGIKLPPLPNPIMNNGDLLGIDTDKNGIRDDLDIWVAETGIDFNERMALRSVLKIEQELIVAALEVNITKFQETYSRLWFVDGCLVKISSMFEKMRGSELSSLTYSKLTTNNKDRRTILERIFRKNVFFYGPPDGIENKEKKSNYSCDFKLQDKNTFEVKLEKVIKERKEKENLENKKRTQSRKRF